MIGAEQLYVRLRLRSICHLHRRWCGTVELQSGHVDTRDVANFLTPPGVQSIQNHAHHGGLR